MRNDELARGITPSHFLLMAMAAFTLAALIIGLATGAINQDSFKQSIPPAHKPITIP